MLLQALKERLWERHFQDCPQLNFSGFLRDRICNLALAARSRSSLRLPNGALQRMGWTDKR